MSEELLESKKKGSGALILLIILLLIMLGAMSYLWSTKKGQLVESQNKVAMLEADMKGMNEMLSGYIGEMSNDMKTDFQNMLSTYDALLEKDASQMDSINAQKERITELLEEVKKGKMNGYQLMKARKEIETMKGIMRGYIVQIDSLNTLNLQLRTDLESTSTQLTQTQGERDELQQKSDILEDKVKEGAKLQAFSFTSEGLKMKLNNTTTPTTRARNVVQIKSTFTLSENKLTPAGNKKVYMAIITPEGKTLQSKAGNIVETDKGAVAFSDFKEVEYKNQRLDMSIYYSLRGEELSKGNYKVRIYCQGSLIGTDSFTLK